MKDFILSFDPELTPTPYKIFKPKYGREIEWRVVPGTMSKLIVSNCGHLARKNTLGQFEPYQGSIGADGHIYVNIKIKKNDFKLIPLKRIVARTFLYGENETRNFRTYLNSIKEKSDCRTTNLHLEYIEYSKLSWFQCEPDQFDLMPMKHFSAGKRLFCLECSAEIVEGWNYCPGCGCELDWKKV